MNIALHFLWGDRKKVPIDNLFLASFGRSADADIVIEDQHISKIHGEFYVDQDRLMIRDLGSTHGIDVNGHRVTEHALEVGDIITLGKFKAFLLIENQALSRELLATGNSQLIKTAPSQKLSLIENTPHAANLALATPQPLALSPQLSATERKPKLIKPWMLIASALVLVLVILAIFNQSKPQPQENLALSQAQYFGIVDQSVEDFRQQRYQESLQKCEGTLMRFGQSQVAHILISLNKQWMNKGDRYEKLNWYKAQQLCEELINAHPNTEVARQLAKDLLLWLKKEERNMATLQETLTLSREGQWDFALAKSKEISPESKFTTLYTVELNNILEESNKLHDNNLKRAAGEQNWALAISEIDILQKNKSPQEELAALKERYQGFIADQKALSAAEQSFGAQKFLDVESSISKIKEDSPYYQKAKDLFNSSEFHKHQRNVQQMYNKGEAQKSIEYAKLHLPKDLAFVQKVQSVLELSAKAQKCLTSKNPEDVLSICLELLALEKNDDNFYNLQAQKWYKQWSDPKYMAQIHVTRGKNALNKDQIEEAVDNFITAQTLDATQGEQELKDLEKRAWDFYSQAMNFFDKGDVVNTKLYLKKSSLHVPKNSKLYDRIESFARKNLSP